MEKTEQDATMLVIDPGNTPVMPCGGELATVVLCTDDRNAIVGFHLELRDGRVIQVSAKA